MAQISASMVKQLREMTGAGMLDCKKALDAVDGDVDAAVEWLRKKGLAAAAKKSGRVAAEGLIGIAAEGTAASVVEVNSETDFVARNETFQEFVSTIAGLALQNNGDADATKSQDYPGTGRTVEEEVAHQISTIGENIAFRRSAALSVSSGLVASYMHNSVSAGLGKIGVIVALTSDASADVLEPLGKQIAMHVAAANPQSVSVDDLDAGVVAKERDILMEQARASGKPEEIIEKMVEGRIRKYYEEVVLLNQTFVVDGESKISQVLETASKEAGNPIEITGFVRFQLGEGIERKEDDFANEVAELAG